MSLDPVPLRPTTCHTSTISYCDFSTRKVQKSTILSFSSRTGPPTKTQSAWSLPEDHDHLPLSTSPSAVFLAAPIGAYDDEIRTVGSSPQTSSCACCGNSARCQL